jgi:hypothetical protein
VDVTLVPEGIPEALNDILAEPEVRVYKDGWKTCEGRAICHSEGSGHEERRIFRIKLRGEDSVLIHNSSEIVGRPGIVEGHDGGDREVSAVERVRDWTEQVRSRNISRHEIDTQYQIGVTIQNRRMNAMPVFISDHHWSR